MSFLIVWGIWKSTNDPAHKLEWILFSILSSCILYLAVMLRQHYALGNQNRIVRLEFRLRYFELYGKSSKEIEEKITFSQIAALRFADDSEFASLLERALQNNTSADELKKSINDWQADDMRV